MSTKHEQVAVPVSGQVLRRLAIRCLTRATVRTPRALVCREFHLLCTARIRSARTDLWSQ